MRFLKRVFAKCFFSILFVLKCICPKCIFRKTDTGAEDSIAWLDTMGKGQEQNHVVLLCPKFHLCHFFLRFPFLGSTADFGVMQIAGKGIEEGLHHPGLCVHCTHIMPPLQSRVKSSQ